MDLRQLRYFAGIVEEKSISLASQRLHVAQPALSQHVLALEAELGVALLLRGSQGVRPTEGGERLYGCSPKPNSLRDLPPDGYYIAPTLFGPVPNHNRLAYDEVFGPVLSVIPSEDEADAIRIANGAEYGLAAGVWTRDGARQLRVAHAMHCGLVFVNGYGAGGGIELPFGGSRSRVKVARRASKRCEFSTIKTIVVRHDSL